MEIFIFSLYIYLCFVCYKIYLFSYYLVFADFLTKLQTQLSTCAFNYPQYVHAYICLICSMILR